MFQLCFGPYRSRIREASLETIFLKRKRTDMYSVSIGRCCAQSFAGLGRSPSNNIQCNRQHWKWKSLSRVWLFATPWSIVYHTPPSMGFSRQGCWSGLPFPSPEDLPDPGIEPRSPTLKADALPSEHQGSTRYKINVQITAYFHATLCWYHWWTLLTSTIFLFQCGCLSLFRLP